MLRIIGAAGLGGLLYMGYLQVFHFDQFIEMAYAFASIIVFIMAGVIALGLFVTCIYLLVTGVRSVIWR